MTLVLFKGNLPKIKGNLLFKQKPNKTFHSILKVPFGTIGTIYKSKTSWDLSDLVLLGS